MPGRCLALHVEKCKLVHTVMNTSRLRREEGAIEVYQANGWRGASRDAVKQTAELERAQRQVRRSFWLSARIFSSVCPHLLC